MGKEGDAGEKVWSDFVIPHPHFLHNAARLWTMSEWRWNLLNDWPHQHQIWKARNEPKFFLIIFRCLLKIVSWKDSSKVFYLRNIRLSGTCAFYSKVDIEFRIGKCVNRPQAPSSRDRPKVFFVRAKGCPSDVTRTVPRDLQSAVWSENAHDIHRPSRWDWEQ